MKKKDYLKRPIRHVDIKAIDATAIIDAMKEMSFSARDLGAAAEIYDRMLADRKCAIILTIAGSTSAGGCMQIYADLVRHHMVDAVVATGATIVDMDFFEALGFRHYRGTPQVDDRELRRLYIDRIYDTYIDEEALQACDRTVKAIADTLPPRPYSSREFIREMGRHLTAHAKKKDSLVQVAYEEDVPIFSPRLLRQQRRVRPRPPSARAAGSTRFHRLRQGFPRTDEGQDRRQDDRASHDRRRGAQEFRPGHGDLRGGSGQGRPHAQIRHPDHRGRRA